ncbi:MAG: FtsX-like permease family protein [Thermoanaerobaculia bacterium]|nr:FtsX-like permease family protein [Thermoanaerobaculia bacterium]
MPGVLLGLAIAHGGIDLVNRALEWNQPPFWISIALHPPVFAFALGATLLAALVAGLLPALQASRVDLNEILKEEGRGGSAGLSIGRVNRMIVITEVAFACVLLVFSALMVRSILNLRNLDLGIEVSQVMTARVGLFASKYPDPADRLNFYEKLVKELEQQPGIESAALTSSLPVSGGEWTAYEVEGHSYADRRDIPDTRLAVVTPAFFDTFGIPLLEGRLFGSQDRPETEPVVVVNRSFAERNWPGEEALGRRIRLGRADPEESWRTVVGVVPDARLGDFNRPEQDGIYAPLTQLDRQFISIAVRTTATDPASTGPLLRETVLAIDRDQPIYWVRTMARTIFEQAFFFNFFATLFMVFGVAALLLAAVGIYGVMAFSVGQRTQEIGIRMALGARREDVLRMVLRQGSARLLIGLGTGLAVAFAGSRFLSVLLFQIEPADPPAFLGTALFLSVVALTACWVPAHRAAQIDPTQALRE